jgi:hypothetical protein
MENSDGWLPFQQCGDCPLPQVGEQSLESRDGPVLGGNRANKNDYKDRCMPVIPATQMYIEGLRSRLAPGKNLRPNEKNN